MVTAWVPWLPQPVCFPDPQLRRGRRLAGLQPAHKATNPESVTRVNSEKYFSADYGRGRLSGPALTMRLLNSLVTRKAMNQLVRTQTPVATPLTGRGKISDMRSQGMGPQPTAKPARARKASGAQGWALGLLKTPWTEAVPESSLGSQVAPLTSDASGLGSIEQRGNGACSEGACGADVKGAERG